MKKYILGVFLVMVLVGMVMAGEPEQTASATVTINEHISMTVTPCNTLTFGTGVDPGTDNIPINCQSSTKEAVNVTVDPVTNVNVDVKINGSDYTQTGVTQKIGVENTTYCVDTYAENGTTTLTSSLTTVSSIAVDGTAQDTLLWYWLDVPDIFLPAGDYTSTYTFATVKQ